MANKKIVKVDFLNVNNKKNSIFENAKYQNNEINQCLNKINNLTREIEEDISKKDNVSNVNKSINFSKKKYK